MTNFEYLKSLSVEDLARLITYLSGDSCYMCSLECKSGDKCLFECIHGRTTFLKCEKSCRIDAMIKYADE